MKKKSIIIMSILLAAFALHIVSCATPSDTSNEQVSASEQEILEIRSRALAAQADSLYPEEFSTAEASLQAARAAEAAKKKDEADKAFEKARCEFLILANLAETHAKQEKIKAYDLVKHAQPDFDKATDLSKESQEKFNSDSKRSLEASEEALMAAQKAADAAFATLIDDAKGKADTNKAKCNKIKAEKSMKETYTSANDKYKQAQAAVSQKSYEKAFDNYMLSAEEFGQAFEGASKKRAEAQKAMQGARKRQEESSKLAREADREAPLPEDAEGFSSEPIDVSEEINRN